MSKRCCNDAKCTKPRFRTHISPLAIDTIGSSIPDDLARAWCRATTLRRAPYSNINDTDFSLFFLLIPESRTCEHTCTRESTPAVCLTWRPCRIDAQVISSFCHCACVHDAGGSRHKSKWTHSNTYLILCMHRRCCHRLQCLSVSLFCAWIHVLQTAWEANDSEHI